MWSQQQKKVDDHHTSSGWLSYRHHLRSEFGELEISNTAWAFARIAARDDRHQNYYHFCCYSYYCFHGYCHFCHSCHCGNSSILVILTWKPPTCLFLPSRASQLGLFDFCNLHSRLSFFPLIIISYSSKNLNRRLKTLANFSCAAIIISIAISIIVTIYWCHGYLHS